MGTVFPEKRIAPGENEEEVERKQKTDRILKELAGKYVRSGDLNYLLGRKKEKEFHQKIAGKFQTAEVAAHLISAATYSLLQILQKKNNSVSVFPAFSKMIERIGFFIQETGRGEQEEYGQKTAALLAPSLDVPLVVMFLCQEFPAPFGHFFYEAVVRFVDNTSMNKAFEWMKAQHEKRGGSANVTTAQMDVVASGFERFLNTSRAKQIIAMNKAQKLLAETEERRKTKRVQTGIKALAKGDMRSLRNKEVCHNLAAIIQKLLENDKESLAAAIIQNIVSGFQEEKSEFHSSFVSIIGEVAERLVLLGRWDWLEELTPVCLAWIRKAETLDPSFRQYVQAMQDMMNHAWHVENNDQAEHILNVFYYIRSGALEKPEDLRKIVTEIQDENVDRALLQAYLDRCFEKPVNELICKRITMQGPVATRFLLDTLISSEERSDRVRLLKILSEVGAPLVPVLLERLPDPMPWYGKRNIIRLLGETGSEKDAEVVLDYIIHGDLRVQQETLQCIVRIGKTLTSQYLLQVLPDAGLRMKVQIVKSLRRVADEAVVAPLGELLDDCKLYQKKERNTLAEEICHTLGASGSAQAFSILQEILDGSEKIFGKGVLEAAENAISTIQELGNGKHRPSNGLYDNENSGNYQPENASLRTDESNKSPIAEYICITDLPEEKEVYELLAKDKLEGAKKTLLKLIKKKARQKHFNDAEALRLRLIDIDSMALAEIIKAAEYIEDAKTDAVDQDHILIWSELYDLLTTEEFNVFYHALEHEKFPMEAPIVNQGDQQWQLFFINKGRVKLFYRDKEEEVLVKTLGGGQIFGGESFFSDSVWTLSAASMGNVEISTLSVDNVEEWKGVYPALVAKIEDYCIRVSRENEFFPASGANRRACKRYAFSETVHLEIFDENENTTSTTFRGEGVDISRSGLSFVSRISRRKPARMLLGRRVEVRFEGSKSSFVKMKPKAHVVAVCNRYSVDLGRSVHICFDTEIEKSVFAKLLADL